MGVKLYSEWAVIWNNLHVYDIFGDGIIYSL